MIWAVILFLLSILLLVWSADRFVLASVAMARRWHWPPLVVGVILVGFGTSFPELVVSLSASLQGQASMAAANVVGSNIANIALIGGLACVLFPLTIARRVWAHDLPVFFILSVVVIVACWYLGFGPWAAAVFAVLLLLAMWDALRAVKKEPQPSDDQITEPMGKPVLWWLIGLVLLFVSAEVLVRSAVYMAHQWGWSDWLIGLTVVTLGTSLPELAATFTSARRGHDDIAVGHLIGSNIFNSTAVLAMPALLGHRAFVVIPLTVAWVIMLGITLLFWLLLFLTRKKPHAPRWIGIVMLLVYGVYLYSVFS